MKGRLLRTLELLMLPLLLSAHRSDDATDAASALPCLQAAQSLAASTGQSLCELACARAWRNEWEGHHVCYADDDQICAGLAEALSCPPCGGPE